MAKYHFTRKAIEDLNGIWYYTANVWSEEQADLYYNQIIHECNNIITNPRRLTLNYNDISDNLYGRRVNKHIIFYRVMLNGDILIVRILHSKMDLKRRINE